MSSDEADRASLLEKAADRLDQAPPGQTDGQPSVPARPAAGVGLTGAVAASARRGATEAHTGTTVDIDIRGLKAQGYLTPGGERTRVAEEFRIIKRPLLENAFGRAGGLVENGNLVMVTSAVPGEGKTYTAINLAMSIAMEMDKTVLLVDADVGRARMHEILKVPMGPGLIDLLTEDSLDVGAVMLHTNIPTLRVIPMGRFHPHATELLASDNMRRLVTELATRYHDRVVIFDSPPLLATSEATVLAGLMGQIVFVVQSGRTLQGQVRDALTLLDTSKPIGLVLNKAHKGIGSDYYGYGSYGYGHYGYHGASKQAGSAASEQ
jgi:protein-tyrosine kinase